MDIMRSIGGCAKRKTKTTNTDNAYNIKIDNLTIKSIIFQLNQHPRLEKANINSQFSNMTKLYFRNVHY